MSKCAAAEFFSSSPRSDDSRRTGEAGGVKLHFRYPPATTGHRAGIAPDSTSIIIESTIFKPTQ